MKGGSDSITKLLDSVGLVIPHSMKAPCTMVDARLFLLFVVAGFRLEQIVSSKPSIVDDYGGTLRGYRDAANHRGTFKSSLKAIAEILCERSKAENSSELAPMESAASSTTTPVHRRVRTRQDDRFEEIRIGCPTIGETPERKSKRQKLYDSSDATMLTVEQRETRSRRKNCLGTPVRCVNPDLVNDRTVEINENNQKSCAVCQKHTPWWCAGCHHFLCTDIKHDNGYYVIDSGMSDRKVCRRTCFMQFHLDALQRAATEETEEDMPHVTPHLSRR